MMKTLRAMHVLTVTLLLAAVASADVKLPSIFGDHMVLQRDRKIPIWGWADPGEKVTVTLGKDSDSATADKNGFWSVSLSRLPAGGPHEITVQGKNTIKLTDVLVGEVWLCSGQSNMEWTVTASADPEKEIAAGNHPQIRLITVPKKTAETPQNNFEGKWEVCTPESVAKFSAVGYYFGRELNQKLKVPVGLVKSAWGGTPSEAWTSRKALEAESFAKPLLDRWDQQMANYDPDKAKANYEKSLKAWEAASAKAKAENKPQPRKPQAPGDPRNNPHRPANLYNAMIAPLIPFPFRGAIWYQGESNVGRAYQYKTIFPLMIENWRKDFKLGSDLAFLFVQIAPYNYGGDTRQAAELRDAQFQTLKLDNTGMAVTMDIGNPKDIHPKNKQDVGRRLALWALAKTYGMEKQVPVYSGPLYRKAKVDGNKIRISFDHVGSGLASRDGKDLTHFQIAGKDQQFVPATAVIEKDQIVVHSDKVAKPEAVRFAWEAAAEPNLMNKEGLPASSFRTDDWPWVTEKAN